MDLWWNNGQNNAPPPDAPKGATASGSQRQNEIRRHHVHDCGFIPGFCSQPNVLSDYSLTSLQVRSDDGDTIIDVAEGGVTVTGTDVTVNASGTVQMTAPTANVNATSGTPLALVNDTWFQWFMASFYPWAITAGYSGSGIPAASETTVLKGQ
jgi:hypothetical protein